MARKIEAVADIGTAVQPTLSMKIKPSKKAESVDTKVSRLSTSARQATRKADLAHKGVQLAKASLKAARRAYKLAKRAAKKAAKKAARGEEELQDFLKSINRKQPKVKKTTPARRPAKRKATRRATVAPPVAMPLPAAGNSESPTEPQT